ncbi:flagellar assembly peptidoglycan hydrolase FlgJ [Vibrio palustris]|uniref:Peptidoglycan hydrolase FlgJ n=1 Tax=Vibrio palustris TaxID=1918946 RepID=A0A1R4B056_9VIBR|nr:flagellar assembly peptidoglycan hydrolase FlgJ [Vibrio palustris]SJL82294.1 Peptidoglycan hydrolase FlgJ [Vibrio palustris]
MADSPNDIGFIQDISGLDSLRKKAIHGDKGAGEEALKSAASQFESIFTNMMLKSMRDANKAFKSGLFDSHTEDMYRQMRDEQMVSQLSEKGSLGLADMIVKQLSVGEAVKAEGGKTFQDEVENVRRARQAAAQQAEPRLPVVGQQDQRPNSVTQTSKTSEAKAISFDSPYEFVKSLKPYADKAAKALGVDSSLLLAQAALETGWGQKVVKNAQHSSYNLFNIKANSAWQGPRVATQTLEYENSVPVMEKAAFRAYPSYKESFNDYVQFLETNPRYSQALTHKGNDDFIRGIHKAGYATDPNYSDKVLRVKAQIESMNDI